MGFVVCVSQAMNFFKKNLGGGDGDSKRTSSAASNRHSAQPSRDSKMPPLGSTIVEDPEEMPSSEEIDRMLEEMLSQQGQKPEVRANIMKLPDDKKWLMLQGFSKQDKNVEPPDDWVTKIHVEPTSANLEKLSVILRTVNVRWVEDFIVVDGVVALCDLLELFEMK